jgi:sigma-E factor negative regulatory protein RseB
VLPNKRMVLVARHSMSGLLNSVAELVRAEVGANYSIEDRGTQRLADRKCRSIAVTPRDEYRYGYHLLVDEETNLPLKLDLVQGDEILEQMMFTQIEFPETITDASLAPTFDTEAFKWVRHQPADAQAGAEPQEAEAAAAKSSPPLAVQDVWEVTQLPPGFRLAESGVRRIGNGDYARQMLFTDGVTTISLFIAPPDSRPEFKGATTMGAVNAYGRQIDGFQATAVGEVPEVTVRFITEHLRRRPTTAAAESSTEK